MMEVIYWDEQHFLFLLHPLIFFNITTNIFYAWSLFLGRGKLKQPLSVLLGYLVFLTIMHGVTMITWHSTYSRKMSASNIAWVLLVLYTNCCMTCHVWLNFCYYSSIVPAKGVLMVWTKKNLKSVIYVLLIGDTMLYLVNGVLNVTTFGTLFSKTNNQSVAGLNDRMTYTFDVFTVIIQLYLFLCMLIMIVSIFSTAHYLGKHIRNIAKSASRLTSPKMKCQIRIAVAGLVEGLFYLLYYIYYVTNTFIVKFHPEAISGPQVIILPNALFFSATAVVIGTSQTVIRQRAADVFRGLKALCGVNKATNDVNLHTSESANKVIKDQMSQ